MLLTKDMLGTVFKCRVTPQCYTYKYTYGSNYKKFSDINGIGQIYNGTTLENKCHVLLNMSQAEFQYINNLVAFDAYCIYTHQSVALADHPLDTSALPVMQLVEFIDTGIVAQYGRLVVTKDVEAGYTTMYTLSSKNNSDLTAWGSPVAKIPWTPDASDYSPRFTGAEKYWGRIPAVLDSILAYTGTDLNTHLSTYFVDFSYGFRVDINARIRNTTGDFNSNVCVSYGPSGKSQHNLKSTYLGGTGASAFAGSTYTSTQPNIDNNDAGGTIIATTIKSVMDNDTFNTFSENFTNLSHFFPQSFTGATTTVLTSAAYGPYGQKAFTITIVTGSDGRLTSITVAPVISGDPELLGYDVFYTLGHGL